MTVESHFRHERTARDVLARVGGDLRLAIRTAPHPDTLNDIVREYLTPAALHGPLEAFVKHALYTHAFTLTSRLGYTASVEAGNFADAERTHGQVKTLLNHFWHQARFKANGKRVYTVSPGAAQRFLLTELRGIRGDDLALPYPSIYIEIPRELGFKIHNVLSGDHPAVGVWVTETIALGSRTWGFCIEGAPTGMRTVDDGALAHFFLPPLDERPVDDILADMAEHFRAHGEERRVALNLSPDGSELDDWLAVFRWVLNLTFYVTRPGFDDLEHVELNPEAEALWRRIQRAPQGKKRERLKERLRGVERRPRIYIGGKIALDTDLPRRVGAVGKALAVRTLVAGHYQRYHVGAGRTETVWKYRAPFWRGPEGVESQKTHHIAEPRT